MFVANRQPGQKPKLKHAGTPNKTKTYRIILYSAVLLFETTILLTYVNSVLWGAEVPFDKKDVLFPKMTTFSCLNPSPCFP